MIADATRAHRKHAALFQLTSWLARVLHRAAERALTFHGMREDHGSGANQPPVLAVARKPTRRAQNVDRFVS